MNKLTEDEVAYNQLIIEAIFKSCGVPGLNAESFMLTVDEEWKERELGDMTPNYIGVAVLTAAEMLGNQNVED